MISQTAIFVTGAGIKKNIGVHATTRRHAAIVIKNRFVVISALSTHYDRGLGSAAPLVRAAAPRVFCRHRVSAIAADDLTERDDTPRT